MQNIAKKERNSNLELFRIISMLLIVAHHLVVNSGITVNVFLNPLSAKSIFLLLLGGWGKMGINCFVLITGYFMCKSKITAKKFCKLLFEIEFYKIAVYLIFVISGYIDFTFKGMLKAVLPFTSIAQNFVGCFLVFYILIPFLNILIRNMTEKQHMYLMLLLGFVYVILGTVFGAGIQFNYITWFIVLYVFASYISLYPKKIFNNTIFWCIAFLSSFVLSAISIVALNYLDAKYNFLTAYFLMADSNKIMAFVTGFCGFMFFKNANIRSSKIINTIAASSFGVLLIHSNSQEMRKWLWMDTLKIAEAYNSNFLIVYAVLSVIVIYIVCTLLDYLRIQLIEKPFFKFWDKHWEKILTKFSYIESIILKKLNID